MIQLKRAVVALGMITLLVACGEEAATEPNETINDSEEREGATEEQTAPKEEPLSIDDILQQSTEAMNQLSGFATEMIMTQEMTLPDQEPFVSETSLFMEMTQDPIQLYQKAQMKLPGMGNMETEMYMVEEGFFFRDGIEDTWFTYPDDVTEELRNLQDLQIDPEEQLALLHEYTDLISVTEEDTHYLLSISGSSEALQAFAQELNDLLSDEMELEFSQLMDQTEIDQLDYVIYIDKDTFYQTKMEMTMGLSLSVDEESLTILSTVHSTFSQFNEIETIAIPAEIIEAAEEYQVDVGDFDEFDLNMIEEEDAFLDSADAHSTEDEAS